MSNLAAIRDRVEATLQDSGNATWATGDIDEAIRRALEEYSLVDPLETITTKSLSSAGREIDISSITGRIAVTRVWWPYTSTDPEYPPNWCTFEEWDDVLFIDSASEPAAADVVRIWYSSLQTIEYLDSATATTLRDPAEGMIVTGAAGFAAQQRAAELAEELNVDHDVVERLSVFAAAMLESFVSALQTRARQLAARASGVAQAPRLDRWDQRSDEEW